MADELVTQGARILSRWLALEILVKNEEEIRLGLKEGNLTARLGVAVIDAYRRYQEAVPRHVVEGTTYFRDAINEIVAGGQKVF